MTTTAAAPRCSITFTSNQAPLEVSFCPELCTSSQATSKFNTNTVLFLNKDDNNDRWYMSLDFYSILPWLGVGSNISKLVKPIYENTHGIVCITMMIKGYTDDISVSRHKYKVVYPQNVLFNGGSGGLSTMKDTILHREVNLIPCETYVKFVQGLLAHKYTYLCLPTSTTTKAEKTTTIPSATTPIQYLSATIFYDNRLR